MSNFKIGEKVVCIKFDNFCLTTNTICNAPKKHEIITIEWISKDGSKIGFEEYSSDDCWDCYYFRKLDYEFAENLLKEISESVNQKHLQN